MWQERKTKEKVEEMMSQEGSGAISDNTRVTVGQLIIAMKRRSRCIAHNVTLAHYQEQAVEAMLLLLDEQGWPLHSLLPLLPASLADGELCRVVWREQTIALSLHQALDEELVFLQSLTAMSRWILAHPDLYRLAAAQEARNAITIIDPICITQLRHSNKEERRDEQTDHGH
jgi:hypothetical protein